MTATATEPRTTAPAGAAPAGVLLVEGSPGFGGSTVGLLRLLCGLDRQRFLPHVVVSHVEQLEYLRRHGAADVDIAVVPRPPPRRVPFSRLDLAWRTLRYVGALRRWCRERRVDLVHGNNAVSINSGAILLARSLGVPYVQKQRGFEWDSGVNRRLARSVDLFLPDSQAVVPRLLELGAAAERMVVTYCAVDPSEYERHTDPQSVRDELGVPAGAPLVGIVACLVDWKGQDVFLDALAQVARERPEVRGLVVGGVPAGVPDAFAQGLRERAEHLGVADRIVFTGHRDDVPRLLAALDVCVHASTRPEPFGTVVAEAMAAGRPVIAARDGGPPEYVEDGRNGLLTEPGDADGLARALLRLLDDPERTREMAAAGRRTARARFGIGEHAAATARAYERVLRRDGSDRA